jgi:hypothetical protein
VLDKMFFKSLLKEQSPEGKIMENVLATVM